MKVIGWAATALLGAGVILTVHQGARSDGDARRGRSLFHRGVDAAGVQLVGALASDGVQLSGSAAACAQCHGHAGAGSREGDIVAPGITGRVLREPTARRPALDDDALLEVITEGLLPDGRRLASSMPRYLLAPGERRDLLAYLRTLGEAFDPGVDAGAIRIGAFLRGPGAEDAGAVLSAFFGEINEHGGVHRRRIEFQPAPAGDAAAWLQGEIFALVGGSLPPDPAVREIQELEGIPVVAPLGARGAADESLVFHLYPTEEQLARVAMQQVLRSDPPFRPLVLHADDEAGRAWARGAAGEAERRTENPVAVIAHAKDGFDPRAAIKALQSANADTVLFAGSAASLLALDRALTEAGMNVSVHAPVALATEAIAGAGRALPRLFFWSPTLLGAEKGVHEFPIFLARHGFAPSRDPVQHHAYAAARLFVEGLRRAGAPPTRAGFVEALESLDEFPTGVTPPVTFGRYRRTGIRGAYLIRFDPATQRLVRAGGWAELAPP